ncbi:hypothetical protein [Nonomuraea salmonea]|uniref:Uncharacterized protein n=1 Tax=Nonomuraea salmonea TaxID=46181 RepID=A0ABV5P2P7_9ACTN
MPVNDSQVRSPEFWQRVRVGSAAFADADMRVAMLGELKRKLRQEASDAGYDLPAIEHSASRLGEMVTVTVRARGRRRFPEPAPVYCIGGCGPHCPICGSA